MGLFIKQLFCKHELEDRYVYEGGYDDYILRVCRKCKKETTQDK